MKSQSRLRWKALPALCAVAVLAGAPAFAQEEAEEDPGKPLGSFWVDLDVWVAQPAGLQYSPATFIDPTNPFGTQPLYIDHGTTDKVRYGVAWELPKQSGELAFAYYSTTDLADLAMERPGIFVYGESLTLPDFAGVNNNGLADSFSAVANTRLRDTRLDYKRSAFRNSRMSGKWFVGWRRVDHDRNHSAAYFALIPLDIPPLIPPAVIIPDGQREALAYGFDSVTRAVVGDTATVSSSFEGRGPTVGIDLEFPLWKNKIVIEGGVDGTVLRGKTTSNYTSRNFFYQLEGTACAMLEPVCPTVLQPEDYDVFDDSFIDPLSQQIAYVANDITQNPLRGGVQTRRISTNGMVLDMYLGLRWRALKWLEVEGGFRSTYYDNVGVDLRPRDTVVDLESGQVIIQSVEQLDRSATYEGFYGGISIRLY